MPFVAIVKIFPSVLHMTVLIMSAETRRMGTVLGEIERSEYEDVAMADRSLLSSRPAVSC